MTVWSSAPQVLDKILEAYRRNCFGCLRSRRLRAECICGADYREGQEVPQPLVEREVPRVACFEPSVKGWVPRPMKQPQVNVCQRPADGLSLFPAFVRDMLRSIDSDDDASDGAASASICTDANAAADTRARADDAPAPPRRRLAAS